MGSPVCAGPLPTVTTLTLSSRRKATLFRIILWRCSATAEHKIAQPKPRSEIVRNRQSACWCSADGETSFRDDRFSALTGAVSGTTGVRAKAAIPLRARNRLHRRRGEGRHLTADRRAQSFDDSLALNGQRYLPHLRSQPPSLRDARSCSDDRRPERGRLSTSHALRIYSECRVV